MNRKFALLMAVVLLCAALVGCSGGGNDEDSMSLYILNWGDFIDEEKLEGFRDEYPNIDLHYDTMTSNEEMMIRLQSSDCIYDLCFPSDYIIIKLIKQDLLQQIDVSKLSNYGNIDERFLGMEFDSENEYSIPYHWGTVGILYNRNMVQETVDSWSILWDEKYSKQIYMYDSVRDSMMVALMKLGYSMNTQDPAEIAAAEAELSAQKPLVLAYGTDDLRDRMISESGAMAVVYSGDAVAAIEENPNLDYVVPMEGSNIWFDNVIIPKNSKNTEAAYLFIDYLLRDDVAAANATYIGYSTPNKAAMDLVDQEMIDNEVWNPGQDIIDRCGTFGDLGDAEKLYHEAWTRLKAQ